MKHYWEELLRAPAGDPPAGDPPIKPDAAAEAAAAALAAAAAAGDPPAGDPPAGDPPAGDPPKKKGSIYDEAGLDEPGKEGAVTWPNDWREQIAKGDEKKMKHLERYASPEAFADSKFAMNQKVSSGEYRRVLADDADEATVKEWRVEQGIPDAPGGYDLPITLDGELADMNDSQKAVYESWQTTFHEQNLSSEVASALTEHGNAIVEAHMEAQAEADAVQLDAFDDAMRADWGAEYRINGKVNVKYLNDTMGEEGSKELMNARMPNGMLLKNSPEFSKMLNNAARANGIGGNMESGELSGMTDKATRKAEIEKIQQTDAGKYTPELRKEYGEILTAMEGKGEIAV